MRLALNYSPSAARLYDAGHIPLDLFKCADFPDMIAAARVHAPVYVHFPLEAGAAPLTSETLDAVAQMADDTQTPFINIHLSCRRQHHPTLHGHGQDFPKSITSFIDQAVQDISQLTSRFPPHRVILENLIYHPPVPPLPENPKSLNPAASGGRLIPNPKSLPSDDFLLPAVLPEVISEVVRQTSCGLLLDLSHARIACHYAGWDPDTYLAKLPLGRLRELHITGLAHHDHLDGRGPVLTDHLPLTEVDLHHFKQALSHIHAGHWAPPDIIAFEYGGTGPPFAWRTDPGVLAGQVPLLYDLIHDS